MVVIIRKARIVLIQLGMFPSALPCGGGNAVTPIPADFSRSPSEKTQTLRAWAWRRTQINVPRRTECPVVNSYLWL